MKHSTYSRRRQMVSTVKKSQATMPAACWRRTRLPGRGGAARGGIEPVTAEDGADRGGRDPHAKPEQLALDALVAPARVLRGEADDQLLEVEVQQWPAAVAVRVGPCAGDQPPMPAQHRPRPDEEARPAGLGARLPLASAKPATTGRDGSARRTSKVTLPRSSPGGEGGGRDAPADRESAQMIAASRRRP
jgi:hypothetical protein